MKSKFSYNMLRRAQMSRKLMLKSTAPWQGWWQKLLFLENT